MHISTPYAYELIDKSGVCKDIFGYRRRFNKILDAIKNNNYIKIIKNIYNKFEEVIFVEYPDLQNIYEDILNSNADKAFMSGSGSTMVGVYPTKERLEKGLEKLKKNGYKAAEAKIRF